MQDRRSDSRKPTILEGRIRVGERMPDIECTVRDLSEAGAQIWAPPSVDLPREFDIDIPKRGQSHRAQIIWSKDRSHGIAFVQKQPETGRGAGAAQASASSHVQDILDDARQQLAQAMGIPPDSIRLRIEIDG